MLDKSVKFSKQNPFQSYKAPFSKRLSRALLDQAYRSTEQIAAPILAIEHQAMICSLTCTRHRAVQRRRLCNIAVVRRWRLAHTHSTRSRSGQRHQGAPFGPIREARGARPGSSPQRASANPDSLWQGVHGSPPPQALRGPEHRSRSVPPTANISGGFWLFTKFTSGGGARAPCLRRGSAWARQHVLPARPGPGAVLVGDPSALSLPVPAAPREPLS